MGRPVTYGDRCGRQQRTGACEGCASEVSFAIEDVFKEILE